MIDLVSDNLSRNVVKSSMDKIIKKEKAVKKLQDAIRRKLPLMTSTQKFQNEMLSMNRQLKKIQEDVKDFSATDIQKVVRGHASRKDLRNQILKDASQEKTAATKIQSAIRKRTAKRDMMKQRQAADEIKLREMEAIKDQSIKDDAGKQLQAKIKRIRPRKDLLNVYKAKEKIGANVKTLLTEQADSQYFPNTKRTMIWNNKTVGQPLVVSKKLKLVSKKKHDAAVEGYQNRQVFLELADKYKDVMTKGKK